MISFWHHYFSLFTFKVFNAVITLTCCSKPGVLLSLGSHRVRHDLMNEQQQQCCDILYFFGNVFGKKDSSSTHRLTERRWCGYTVLMWSEAVKHRCFVWLKDTITLIARFQKLSTSAIFYTGLESLVYGSYWFTWESINYTV